ncbi:MAG: FadR family transcriptional regulator [Chloroflexi bacterium]|nr:FadR family transcriptional regulator [Chloroflexota bacterium]MBV9544863.1 FadR family transcriptional regulator [Chloroflexota bacterium]
MLSVVAATDLPDVVLEPVKRSRIYEHIVDQIHALIREGRWAPGDQIPPERELAERFKVSRTSVREALRALEMQGVIESRQGGGTFVRTADTEALVPPLAAAILRGQRELTEVLEVRELIEPGIARLAAARATGEHIAELSQLLERQRDCIAHGRPFVDEDTAFHYTLARAADNHILLRLHNVILDLLRESRQSYLHVPDRPRTSLRGHEAILAAVVAHDAEAAYAASLAHITEVREGILRALAGGLSLEEAS